MKESTGSVSAIYIVVFFVIIMFGFIISTLSYFKSYKINNSLTAAIEDYGGFNSLSKVEIERRLTSYGYSRGDITCSIKDPAYEKFVKADGTVIEEDKKTVKSSELGYKGYCVTVVDDTPEPKEGETKMDYEYYSYKVSTYMTLDFGLFDLNIPIKMSTRTSTLYSCFGGVLNCSVGD